MNNTLRMILGAIITLALAWVILSLILQWARPSLYTASGSVNWWTTLWITIVLFVILWVVLAILYFLTSGNRDACCDTGNTTTVNNGNNLTTVPTNAVPANMVNSAHTGYNSYNSWGLWN